MRVAAASALLALCCALSSPALAQKIALPGSLVGAALADPSPSAFAPGDLGTEDYTLRNLGAVSQPPQPSALLLELVPGSLAWVRVAGTVVVPRAVLRVSAPGASEGQVRVAGVVQPLVVKGGVARAEVPVALLDTPAAAIDVESLRGGVHRVESFGIAYVPRPQHRGLIMFDPSCSPHGVRVLQGSIPDASWLHIGCRLIRTAYEGRVAATLELYALWSGGHEPFEVEGVPTQPTLETLQVLRVTEARGAVRLRARGRELVLGYLAPERLQAAFVGLGVGPYYYRLHDGRTDLQTILPLVTLYASYSFSDDIRFVYFNATIPDAHGSIDQGLYVWFEQARFLDDRVSLSVLLGGNLLIYPHDSVTRVRVSIPQGVEVAFRDFLFENRNLTGGAFVYPRFEGRAYYNAWLRWGSPQVFGELNYIEWLEPHDKGGRTRSRAFGISFGTPLVRFL